MGDVHVRWIAIPKQSLDTDVHEFIHPRTGLEERLDHQPACALAAVRGLNQTFDFPVLQPGDRLVPHARGLERQPAMDPLGIR
jgi:hypothetical protein